MNVKLRVRNYVGAALVLALALSAVMIPGVASASTAPTIASENSFNHAKLALVKKVTEVLTVQIKDYAKGKVTGALTEAIGNSVDALETYLEELEVSLGEEWTVLLGFEIDCTAATDGAGYLVCEAIFREAVEPVVQELKIVQNALVLVRELSQVGAIYEQAGAIKDWVQEANGDLADIRAVTKLTGQLYATGESAANYSTAPVTTTTKPVLPTTTTSTTSTTTTTVAGQAN